MTFSLPQLGQLTTALARSVRVSVISKPFSQLSHLNSYRGMAPPVNSARPASSRPLPSPVRTTSSGGPQFSQKRSASMASRRLPLEHSALASLDDAFAARRVVLLGVATGARRTPPVLTARDGSIPNGETASQARRIDTTVSSPALRLRLADRLQRDPRLEGRHEAFHVSQAPGHPTSAERGSTLERKGSCSWGAR
jgi:hypothetical protein